MKFYDAAAARDYGAAGLGFENVGVIGSGVVLHRADALRDLQSRQRIPGKMNILASPDPEVLRLAARRFDALYSSNLLADPAFIREAAARSVPFEVPFRPFLESKGIERARLLKKARFFLKICVKYEADFFFTSRAANELEARTPFEIAAVGQAALGLSRDQALRALSAVPKKLLGKK